MIWDNSPAHRGDTLRAYLATPGLRLPLVNPVSSTGQALCLGANALVQAKVSDFFTQLSSLRDQVKRRCRTAGQLVRIDPSLGMAEFIDEVCHSIQLYSEDLTQVS